MTSNLVPFDLVYAHCSSWFLWFRVFGVGLKIKRLSKHPHTFSERYGLVRHVDLFGWCVALLPQNRTQERKEA